MAKYQPVLRWLVETSASVAGELDTVRHRLAHIKAPLERARAQLAAIEAQAQDQPEREVLLARRLAALHTTIRVYDGTLDPATVRLVRRHSPTRASLQDAALAVVSAQPLSCSALADAIAMCLGRTFFCRKERYRWIQNSIKSLLKRLTTDGRLVHSRDARTGRLCYGLPPPAANSLAALRAQAMQAGLEIAQQEPDA